MGSPWKALSEDNRWQILLLLGKRDITPTEIAKHLNSSLPLVSTQLRILKDADLITEKNKERTGYIHWIERNIRDGTILWGNVWL
jgi:DNA-binding transcriptional ArsR family regulator